MRGVKTWILCAFHTRGEVNTHTLERPSNRGRLEQVLGKRGNSEEAAGGLTEQYTQYKRTLELLISLWDSLMFGWVPKNAALATDDFWVSARTLAGGKDTAVSTRILG